MTTKYFPKLKYILQNISLIMFTLYSLMFISFPLVFKGLNLFVVASVFLIVTICSSPGIAGIKDIKVFLFCLLLYAFWIVLSFIVHFSALQGLDPNTYITFRKETVIWGLRTLTDGTLLYLMFPLLFFSAIYIIKANNNCYRKLYLLPLLIVPSLLVGMYQGFVDIEFLNHPYFIKLNRVSGLDNDANGFGISIFLLVPLCIIAAFQFHNKWKKLLFIMLAVILLLCLFLSGSLTGMLGVIIFISILPFIWVWACNEKGRRCHRLLATGPIVVIVIAVAASVSWQINLFPALNKKIGFYYLNFKKGGIEEILKKSGRLEFGIQAARLTELSPVSGWGPGGFKRNLNNMRYRRGTMFFWLSDNANNQYLQMSSTLGLLGVFLNVIMHLLPLWAIFKVRKKIQDRDERLATGILFAAVCIMMLLFMSGPHTMAVSVLWVLVLFLSVLFLTAINYGYEFRPFNKKYLVVLSVLLSIVFFCGSYLNAYGQEGYRSRQNAVWWPFKYEKNCYGAEEFRDGYLRWCKGGASLQIVLPKDVPEQLQITLIVYHPDKHVRPVKVLYGGKNGPANEIVFKEHTKKTINIPITEDYLFRFKRPFFKGYENYFVISLDVSRTWVPKDWGVSDDARELGVAVFVPDNKSCSGDL